MQNLLHMHWLWLFGALWLGIVVGWATYLLAATCMAIRPAHVAAGVVAIGAVLVVAKVVPARYGTRLEIGTVLAVVGAIGCFVGWALRDIAEFAPASTRSSAATATAGTYLFRDAFAGMGADAAYMRATSMRATSIRATSGHGGPARPVPSAASLAQAPAPGGYTFPGTLPFADATDSRCAAATGPRRHWTWPA